MGSLPAHANGRSRLVLVVEDEVIIALDLSATLEDEGYRVLGPAPTVAAALKLLERERPDAAVLDVNLRGETVTPVARVLREMRVPFALASAYGLALLPSDEVLTNAPHLGKPMAPATLLAAMTDLLGREAG
jgi:DNA-binding response OmpR family regulator